MTSLFLLIARRSSLIALLIVVPAASAADLNKVNAALARGTGFLKQMYGPAGTGTQGQYGLGATALSGLAMLEAKVKPDDPAIANIARFVRAGAPAETRTYHVALAILFLDRLGDKRDVPLIQMLGVRLYSGLQASGGWGYNCGAPGAGVAPGIPGGVAPPQAPVRPPPRKKPPKDDGFPQAKPGGGQARSDDDEPATLHPAAAQYYAAVRRAIRGGRPNEGTDNSNTQFGLIGLWVAARHGVPAEDAFALIEARFLVSQNTGDGGWGYSHAVGGRERSTAAMTCAGLLGLAVGQARGPVGKSRTSEPTDPNDPFFNPKKDGKGAPASGPKPIVAADRKRAIDMGLKAVGAVIRATGGAKAQPKGNLPGVAFGPGGGQGLDAFVGLGNEFYLLWSVERVAMAFGLDSIGDADWHDWGCNFLLPAQQADGSWGEGAGGHGYGADVNTSFALLFLSRSNFVRDLTRKITGQVKDPGQAELRGTKDRPPLFAPPEKGGSTGPGESPPAAPPSEPPPEKTPGLPPVQAPSDPLADALVAATGADFDAKLKAERDAKGSPHTAALVRAIPRLDSDRKKQARDALATRLTRMTANSLRAMLKAEDAELRRAACLACAMKDDRQHVPDLIERITDKSELVVPAARASLKSLTEKDFGPSPGADDAAKAKAQAAWKKWYES
ncbi:MAG TPA: hypothetical protein VFG68_08375, partial [Fimbriiglobus sp.]|nr:hypothetical protein [Fimbriiglobus sp.]